MSNNQTVKFEITGTEEKFNLLQQEPADTGLEILNALRYVRPGAGYDPNFAVMGKVDVNGANEHPLFTYLKVDRFEDNLFYSPLKNEDIRWNFEQFIIDRNGKAVL
ncbi:glutathione peroxidase-like [Mytilus galloprovincialis]|uniref:glutathione peroxidase-like n=1 Tax=Mytilus galloprovincialis TaxID=29158 RepID=UPI003F7C7FFC